MYSLCYNNDMTELSPEDGNRIEHIVDTRGISYAAARAILGISQDIVDDSSSHEVRSDSPRRKNGWTI